MQGYSFTKLSCQRLYEFIEYRGLQKEAYFAGKRAVVIMLDTGWRELVEARWNILADPGRIYEAVFNYKKTSCPVGLYGNGDAGRKIVEILMNENRSC